MTKARKCYGGHNHCVHTLAVNMRNKKGRIHTPQGNLKRERRGELYANDAGMILGQQQDSQR